MLLTCDNVGMISLQIVKMDLVKIGEKLKKFWRMKEHIWNWCFSFCIKDASAV